MASSLLERLRSNLTALIRRLVHSHQSESASTDLPASTSSRPVPPVAATGSKSMRSPEQVRADLARLRATSGERHAPASIKRQESFDDSVFANFVATPAVPAPTPEGLDEYPKTVLVPRAATPKKSTR
ncbi:hypothetical protein [Variovorax sp. GT1P44]|uniref:hypothetical protein n=1 Tax=Variovorax sp. GT1P44 TaxID=3443742 RepID=UPI003F4784C6